MDQTSRITISLPTSYLKRIKKVVPKRKISKTFKDAMDDHLPNLEKKKKEDPIDAFFALRKRTPKLSHEEIMKSLMRDRDEHYANLYR